MNEIVLNYGVLGICFVGLVFYFNKQEKRARSDQERLEKQHEAKVLQIEERHKAEREEWRKSIDKQFEEQNRNTREQVNNMKEHISLLSSLKILIETTRHK